MSVLQNNIKIYVRVLKLMARDYPTFVQLIQVKIYFSFSLSDSFCTVSMGLVADVIGHVAAEAIVNKTLSDIKLKRNDKVKQYGIIFMATTFSQLKLVPS